MWTSGSYVIYDIHFLAVMLYYSIDVNPDIVIVAALSWACSSTKHVPDGNYLVDDVRINVTLHSLY